MGLRALLPDLSIFGGVAGVAFGIGDERRVLERVIALLHELQETLEAGVLPARERWEALREVGEPWGELAHGSLEEIRASGGSLLPTLRRLRQLAEAHRDSLLEAKAKSSQALAQSAACGMLVPVFGGALYLLLPGVSDRIGTWSLACGCAASASIAAAVWLLSLAESARWGGLSKSRRPWVLAAYCMGERLLARVRTGVPPDLAWERSFAPLVAAAPELARLWGADVWAGAGEDGAPGDAPRAPSASTAASVLVGAGDAIRKAIQVSLMEGRPCAERIESVLASLRQDVRAGMERELALLGTRALLPLFTLVAPALLGLLALGLWLGWDNALGG